MTPSEKITRLFSGFTQRFGALPLRDGQSLAAIQRSWERALGDYAFNELARIAQNWCDTARKPFWPEIGDMQDGIKAMGITPERNVLDKRPEHIKQAERDFATWHAGMLSNFPRFVDDKLVSASDAEAALAWMIHQPGKSFAWAGTDAWLSNLLPTRFDELLRDWVARAKRGRATYLAHKQAGGVRFANTTEPVKTLWERATA